MLIESPARIVAVRPEIVVMRGSASTRAFPFCTRRFTATWNAIPVRVSGCRRMSRPGWPVVGSGVG